MLGLRIALSVAKGIIDEIGGLLSKLARRSTYSENLADSRAVVSDIDSYDLLDKATILLTPTATSDARVHSVKTEPSETLRDDFSTDTTGSYTIATDDGTPRATFTHQTTFARVTYSGTNGAALFRNSILTDGHSYKVTFRAKGTRATSFSSVGNNNDIGLAISNPTLTTDWQNYEFIIDATQAILRLYQSSGSATETLDIDDILVVDVSSDFDFDRASSATRINSSGLVQDMQSITDPELMLNGDFEELGDELVTNGTFDTDSNWGISSYDTIIENGVAKFPTTNGSFLIQGNVVSASIKNYRLQYDVVETNGGNLRLSGGSSAFGTIPLNSSLGTHTFYLQSNGAQTNLQFNNQSSFVGSIDNVSVKQVDPNDRWTLGTGWSIEDGVASIDGSQSTNSDLQQSFTTETGKQYKITYTISNYSGTGNILVRINSGNITTAQSSNGTFTEVLTGAGGNTIRLRANADFIGTVDNVSVKDITFSTDVDLARINYDSNGDNGHILLEPTSTNLITYSEDIDSLNNGDGEVGVNSTLTYESDVIAPDGSLGVYRIQNPATASTYLKVTNNTTAAQSMSVWVKAKTVGTNNQFTLFRDGTGSSASDVKTATGDWQRFEYSWGTVGSGAYFINNDGDTYASDLYVWGFQVEALSYATSYIPTLTGSTVTRATETLTGSGNSTLINSTEGVLYAEIAMLSEDDKDSNNQLFISDGTANQRVGIFTESAGDVRVQIKDSAETPDSRNLTALDQSESGIDTAAFNKIAILYKSGQNKLFVNGSRITDTNFDSMVFNFSSLDNLEFGSGANSNYFRGKVKALAVFDETLEDDELELLTGVTNYGSFGELASANGYTII